jgi:hypothetical protein
MTAKLSFLTVQTNIGRLHTMRISGGDTALTGSREPVHYNLFPARPVTEYLAWKGPAYLAENGTAFRIGRNVAGGLVAWKSVKFSKRFKAEVYRMRSVPGGYLGDYATSWSRAINGKTYSFSRIFWDGGKGGCTLRVYEGQSTKIVHEWHTKGPVSMKGAAKL